jgi:hypothetical protein
VHSQLNPFCMYPTRHTIIPYLEIANFIVQYLQRHGPTKGAVLGTAIMSHWPGISPKHSLGGLASFVSHQCPSVEHRFPNPENRTIDEFLIHGDERPYAPTSLATKKCHNLQALFSNPNENGLWIKKSAPYNLKEIAEEPEFCHLGPLQSEEIKQIHREFLTEISPDIRQEFTELLEQPDYWKGWAKLMAPREFLHNSWKGYRHRCIGQHFLRRIKQSGIELTPEGLARVLDELRSPIQQPTWETAPPGFSATATGPAVTPNMTELQRHMLKAVALMTDVELGEIKLPALVSIAIAKELNN